MASLGNDDLKGQWLSTIAQIRKKIYESQSITEEQNHIDRGFLFVIVNGTNACIINIKLKHREIHKHDEAYA